MVIKEIGQGGKHQKCMKILKKKNTRENKQQNKKGARLKFGWKELQMQQSTV